MQNRRLRCERGIQQSVIVRPWIEAAVIRGNGDVVDLGEITSPYKDRFRNWFWKRFIKEPEVARRLQTSLLRIWWDTTALRSQHAMASVYTSVGKNWVADKMRYTNNVAVGLVNTQPNDTPRFVGWGTGAGTAAVGDTTLFTESADPASRATATLSGVTTTVTGDTFQAVGTLTSGIGQTITNAGLFDTVTTGDMVMKGDHAGVPLLANDAIQYTFKLQQT